MILEWSRDESGVLSALTNPFRAYMDLHGWHERCERRKEFLSKAGEDDLNLPESTQKRLQENALRHDRLMRIYPELEIRILNDDFARPRFTPEGRTYEPIKRMEFHLHFTPSLSCPGASSDIESLPLWNWFHVLADDERQARQVAQALATILPGTRIADPEWVLELDRRLCVDRYALKNFPPFRMPLQYLEDSEPLLRSEFELACGAAQEACAMIRNPAFSGMVTPLGFLKDHARTVFDKRSADQDESERRRSIMVQNAVMCHVQSVMSSLPRNAGQRQPSPSESASKHLSP